MPRVRRVVGGGRYGRHQQRGPKKAKWKVPLYFSVKFLFFIIDVR